MNERTEDPEQYMVRASEMAVAGISEWLARRVGSLVGHNRWSDEHGHWLQVRAELDTVPDLEIRFARVLLPASGAVMDAESEAAIFSSGFEERLDTRLHRTEPVDGIVTL